jgi:tRNA-splicing ligase RtcB (3'-phosphate/5'-hydroxy nucleic acid ligase)
MTYTGKDLIEAGYPEGEGFKEALEEINKPRVFHNPIFSLYDWVVLNKPPAKLQLQVSTSLIVNMESTTVEDIDNTNNCIETMEEVTKTPTIRKAVLMPDACPAGPSGTIPVGGVVAAEGAIHPGMHSADICCSMTMSEFKNVHPLKLLNAVEKITHFGPGGRKNGNRFSLSPKIYDQMKNNSFLDSSKAIQLATEHMGTQGDGNHFAFVGINNSGNTCLVTHHGSRGPGAFLYKKGMDAAQKYTRKIAEGILKQNAWLSIDTDQGRDYWDALQIIRKWTKSNHSAIHEAAADVADGKIINRIWNEHNFVFRDTDNLFYHAKGATPIHNDFMPDSSGVQIVPLNMAEPVLLIEGTRNSDNLGFAPHGAGRNISRTKHIKNKTEEFMKSHITVEDYDHTESVLNYTFKQETKDIDARFFSGRIDISELPSAYKNAQQVRSQMEAMDLATVVDEIQPYGSIMAGDWEYDAPWRKKKRES